MHLQRTLRSNLGENNTPKRKKDSTGNKIMTNLRDKAKKTKLGNDTSNRTKSKSVISVSGNNGEPESRKDDSDESIRQALNRFMKQMNQIQEDNKQIQEEVKKLTLKITEDRPPVMSVYEKSNTANNILLSEDGLSKGM